MTPLLPRAKECNEHIWGKNCFYPLRPGPGQVSIYCLNLEGHLFLGSMSMRPGLPQGENKSVPAQSHTWANCRKAVNAGKLHRAKSPGKHLPKSLHPELAKYLNPKTILKSDACGFLTPGLPELLPEDKSAEATHSCPAASQPFLRWAERREQLCCTRADRNPPSSSEECRGCTQGPGKQVILVALKGTIDCEWFFSPGISDLWDKHCCSL